MAKQNKKQNGREIVEVKVDMETLLKGAKVMLKEKQKEVALRTIVGVSKAMPEVKAVFRNVIFHASVEAGKVMTEAIVGQNDFVDGASKFIHGTISVNTAYNTIVGVNNFAKGYKKATKEDIMKVFAPAIEAAERYEEEEDDEDVIDMEEVNEETVDTEVNEEVNEEKEIADLVRGMNDKELSIIYSNYVDMTKKIEELTKRLNEADRKVEKLESENK